MSEKYSFGGLGNLFKCGCGCSEFIRADVLPKDKEIYECTKCHEWYGKRQTGTVNFASVQPCGHPLSAIVTNGTISYCGQCADDSLRANIAAGVEA